MHVPAVVAGDLDEARPLIGFEHLGRHQAGIAQPRIAIREPLRRGETESLVDQRVVHQLLRGPVEIVVVLERSAVGRIHAQIVVERVQQLHAVGEARLAGGIGGIGDSAAIGRDFERTKVRGQIARPSRGA